MAPRKRAPPKNKAQEQPQQQDAPADAQQQQHGENAAPPAHEQHDQPQQEQQQQPEQQHEQAPPAQEQQHQDGQPQQEGVHEQHQGEQPAAPGAQEEAAAKPAPRSRSRKQSQQKPAEGEQKQDGEPSARGRARSTRAKPAPAPPQGVTKRSTRAPAKKEVPAEEAQKAAPSRSRSRASAAPKAQPARKPAARSRAPSTKKADAQKDKADEDAQPASARKAAPSRSRSRAAQPKKEAAPAAPSRSRSRAAPEKKEAAPAAPSRSRSRAAPARSGTTAARRGSGSRSGSRTAATPRQRAAPAASRSRKRAAPAEEEEEKGQEEGKEEEQEHEGAEGEGEGQQPPKRQAGRRAPASRSGSRRPSGSGASRRTGRADTSKQVPARKRKADDAEVPAEPTSEKDVEQDASRPAKRQRVAKAPKGAAPTPDSEAMAAQQMLSKVPPAEVFVWGSNPFGGLGLGEEDTLKFRPTQVPVPNVLFAEVVCGGMHTVALSTTGEVWTWGVNDEGALGRKTLGTAWEAYPDSEKADEKVPGKAVLPDGVRMVEIAAGDGFTVARTPGGAVYGCGTFKDDVGGLSGFTDSVKVQSLMAPLYEPSDPKEQAVKLVAGARHCALLTKTGLVLTWGIGGQGQLGRLPAFDAHAVPPVSELFVPKMVPPNKIPIRSTSIATIATGAYSTFVISKAGDVVAWGLNNSCQLGINKGDEQNNLVWEPTKVTSISKVAAIKGGEQHTLILGKDGRLYSCGAPTYGMLGREGLDVNNANDKYFEPKPVHGFEHPPQERGKAVTQIEAGTNISACTQEDGTAWLWGSQVNYQLAKGDTDEDAVVPEKLKRAKTFGFRKIYSISFGGQHAALLAGPQEQPPAPPPASAEGAAPAPPAENGGAGPSGTAAPPAQGEPPSAAADGANAGAAAPAPAPPAQPAPPAAAPEQPVHEQQQPQQPQEQQQQQQQQEPPAPAPSVAGPNEGQEAPPSQSAIDAAMAWAQQMMNQGGAGALMGNVGGAQQPQGGMQQQGQQPQ